MQVKVMPSIILRKELPSTSLLRNWYSILRPGEQVFVASKLKALQFLDRLQLDWDLLQNLLSRWDQDSHTFRFGALELATTYEEYLYLSELPHRPGILPLPRTGSPYDDLPSVLRISAAAVQHLVTPQGHIQIEALLTFQNAAYVPDRRDGQSSARAFILLFVGAILYPFTEASIHGRAVFLAKAILEDRPFIPNILGETYFSIDRISARAREGARLHRASFCLSLLQAWFVTHLGITGFSLCQGHYPGLLMRIADRAYLPGRSTSHTRTFFEGLTEEGLYPMARCFQAGPIITSSKDGPYIPIMGITGSSYYIPLRVAHQFGGIAEIPPPPSTLFPPIELDTPGSAKTKNQRSIAHITGVWYQLTTKTFPPPEVDAAQVDATTQRFKRRRNSRWDQ